MRKSKFKITAIVAIVLCFALAASLLAGCSSTSGQAGANGIAPHIGENGNWWIGDADTGVKAAGANGAPGQDGANGAIPRIGENGNWWIGDTDTGIKAAGDSRVTPEMFGAVGDGIADDTAALQSALNTGKPIYLSKTYRVTELDCTNVEKIVMLGKNDLTARLGTSPVENDEYNIIFEGEMLFKNAPIRLSLEQVRFYAKNEGTLLDTQINGAWVKRCNFTNFGGVFMGGVKTLCQITENTFCELSGTLCSGSIDSYFTNNYISGKLSRRVTVFTGVSVAGSTFQGNTISHCKTVFGKFELWEFNRIDGNLFSDIFKVFDVRKQFNDTVIKGNTFANIDYTLAKDGWGEHADSEMKNKEWTAITISQQCDRVNISGNSGNATVALKMNPSVKNPCDTYIDLTAVKGKIEFGYYNTSNTEGSSVFVKDLDYITVDSLPSAALYDTTGNPIPSFNNQHVFYQGNLYINNNGTWVKLSNNAQQ